MKVFFEWGIGLAGDHRLYDPWKVFVLQFVDLLGHFIRCDRVFEVYKGLEYNGSLVVVLVYIVYGNARLRFPVGDHGFVHVLALHALTSEFG